MSTFKSLFEMHVAAPTPEKRQIVAFEMPPGRSADAAPTVNKAFNSLFEMLRSGKTTVLELVQSIIFQFST
jgi:hypothetical protein